jgi:hypothetical protein
MGLAKPAIAAAFAALALAACQPAPAAGPTPEQIAAVETAAVLQTRLAELQAPRASASPSVYFVNLRDGDVVSSPVRVIFGLSGMGVAPAGIEKENTGHHHLLVDTELTQEEMQFAIPNSGQHLHFGLGQTETVLELTPGPHTLQLVLGDKAHELFVPPVMSEKITITVK